MSIEKPYQPTKEDVKKDEVVKDKIEEKEKKEYEPGIGLAIILEHKGVSFKQMSESEAFISNEMYENGSWKEKSIFGKEPFVQIIHPEINLNPDYKINYIPDEVFKKLDSDEKLLMWLHGSNYKDYYIFRDPKIKNAKVIKLYKNIYSSPELDKIEIEIFGEKYLGNLSLIRSMDGIVGYRFYPEFKTINANGWDMVISKKLVPKEILERDEDHMFN